MRILLLLLFLTWMFPILAWAELSDKTDSTACFDKGCFGTQDITAVEIFFDMDFERVIDGDTFEASGKKIRLWGIDAPEKNEPGHWAATKLLEGLLSNNNDDDDLGCKLVDVDQYKRDVMHCFIDGLDVGSMMVQMGMATDYLKYSGGYYQFEEAKAKEEGRGIWKKSTGESQ